MSGGAPLPWKTVAALAGDVSILNQDDVAFVAENLKKVAWDAVHEAADVNWDGSVDVKDFKLFEAVFNTTLTEANRDYCILSATTTVENRISLALA